MSQEAGTIDRKGQMPPNPAGARPSTGEHQYWRHHPKSRAALVVIAALAAGGSIVLVRSIAEGGTIDHKNSELTQAGTETANANNAKSDAQTAQSKANIMTVHNDMLSFDFSPALADKVEETSRDSGVYQIPIKIGDCAITIGIANPLSVHSAVAPTSEPLYLQWPITIQDNQTASEGVKPTNINVLPANQTTPGNLYTQAEYNKQFEEQSAYLAKSCK